MFHRVLVANRGEIALRVFRTLKRLGVEGVAVYSDADAGAPYTRAATEAVRLGPTEPKASYLDGARLISAAKRTRAEAIHPGYGFLAENAAFAQAVLDAGLAWIGPPPRAMHALGAKVSARQLAQKNAVPVAPGSGVLSDAAEARRAAQDVGYPVLLKASAGGGGIGMRVVRSSAEMDDELEGARATALSAFGDGSVFLEKYLERPRHIELQVIGDEHGNLVHLGERECSVQRRHQKLLEEAPSPALNERERQSLAEVGLRLMRAAGYRNAGTLEFLYQDGEFYFNEVNARLQVEHPVTEAVYGVDLVEAQLRAAAGERLQFQQADLKPRGHAVEVRINAEDPLNDFAPSPGLIRRWDLAQTAGIRVDSGVEEGWRVPAQYDSLLAKVIAWGPTRPEAIARLRTCLDQSRIEGLTTNLAFHRALLADDAFQRGDLSTRFLTERPVVEGLRADRAQRRSRALVLAAALSTAPRGGLGLLHHAATLPRRLPEVPR